MHASVSVCACMQMCIYLHISVHNNYYAVQGQRYIAVLDWYSPEADPIHW